jgi:NADH-quinone oxidoreductase subunit J
MTIMQIIFLILGLVTLLSAVMVVTSPQLIHAGLWLILALAGIAGLFVLLQAPFLAVVQVVIYIGAIAILIIFAIMLTRRMGAEGGQQMNALWPGAVVVSLIMFSVLTFLILQSPQFAGSAAELTTETGVLLEDLGRSLVDVDRFILPFELASILLLAALVGAIYIARPAMVGEDDGGES